MSPRQPMLKTDTVFQQLRSEFIDKASTVHLFWGDFDLAVTRFSDNPAPLHQGGIPNMPLDVMQEAYSQEVNSAGFGSRSKDSPLPVFYVYAYPASDDFVKQKMLPEAAFFSNEMGAFSLKDEDVQRAADPGKVLYDFLQSTYETAVNTANWERAKLER